MLYSILQIIAFQALFLLVYDLFLKRETFFNYNRAYLIITSILSLALPFVKFSELKTMATKDRVIRLPEVFIGPKTLTLYDIQIAEQAGIVIEQPQTPIWQIIALVGMLIASIIFLIKIIKIYWIKHKNPKRWQGNVLIVQLMKSTAAFSFFNTIFLGEHISETEKPTIYEHELVHIKDYHTLDLLFFEVLRIVFWFNPLVYIFQNRIKELHEYIADAKAVKQSGKVDYYKSLLNQIMDVNQVSFTNTFFKKSLIKKRITMLQKSKSKQLNLLKYTLLIPIVFGMLIYTSTEVRAQEKSEVNQVVDQELTEEQMIKKYYDELVKIDKDGASFNQIMEYGGLTEENSYKYIVSKETFLKSKALLNYFSNKGIQRNSENGNLTQNNIYRSEKLTEAGLKTYSDYREWRKTKEAKDLWEATARDGEIKLYIEDFLNKTNEEQNRYDSALKQIETDENFDKLIVASANTFMVLTDVKNENSNSIISEVEQNIEVPFSAVEEVPTLPECKDLPTNAERKNCMNMFVNKHIGKNFNTSIADNLSPGRKRVFVQFKIDKEGKIIDIGARGPSEALEIEAKRVVATLPQFIPGKQKGKIVVVPFSIPIVFEVKDNSSDTKNNRITTDSDEKSVEFSPSEYVNSEWDNEIESWNTVKVAPIHPDCNGVSSVLEQKECTINAINKHIGKNFNTNLGNTLGLPAGQKRIFARLVIGIDGTVTDVQARGAHPKLEEEAIRVIKLLPKFTPGTHDGKPIGVDYALPIVFQTTEPKKD
ncbi:energy transducer TonB [Winogradskyella forsetii]|uniref:energy transducer TonB n=1 Tax=Winogradskyella forsetii TaxID=2686077 RepID=UPI0015B9A4B8|nr:energy transducer TonB [Winogradskyella forsetii]